jgi:Rnl2 family RNA ligase
MQYDTLYQIIQNSSVPYSKPLVTVVGELFGDIVNTDVFYSASITEPKFKVFDIFVDGKCINYETVITWCKEADIPYVSILAKGTFTELYTNLTTDVENFESEIYKEYNETLPEHITKNYAEGYILKPIEYRKFPKGDRVIVKVKHSKYNECVATSIIGTTTTAHVNRKRYEDEDQDKYRRELLIKFPELKDVCAEAVQYVNTTRLQNVLSNLSEEEKQNNTIKVNKLVQDAWKDFTSDCQIEKKFRSFILNAMREQARSLISHTYEATLNKLDKYKQNVTKVLEQQQTSIEVHQQASDALELKQLEILNYKIDSQLTKHV